MKQKKKKAKKRAENNSKILGIGYEELIQLYHWSKSSLPLYFTISLICLMEKLFFFLCFNFHFLILFLFVRFEIFFFISSLQYWYWNTPPILHILSILAFSIDFYEFRPWSAIKWNNLTMWKQLVLNLHMELTVEKY